jgi:gamma-glutamyltranspeptidase/glutathione hydrolase
MVTSPHALASAAGVDVLRAGGSAVDAAIATSAVLAVVYPHMTSIGGDAFWLVHEGATGRIRFLNGGGKAAATGTIDAFRSRGLDEIPFRGMLPATLTVPGAPASWTEAHGVYGRLPLPRVLAAAIGYARDGFPVTRRLSAFIAATREELARNVHSAAIFLPGGDVPAAGARLSNPALARSLTALATDGWAGFYAGDVAREICRFAAMEGGFFRETDFAVQRATWGEPISGTYNGVTIYNTPPPTQGFTVLEMLNLLEPYRLGERPYLGADMVHLMVQAKQIAYHDRDRLLADPAFAAVPIDDLVSKAYADKRRTLIRPERALAWDEVPSYGSLAGDTVFLGVVDAQGNAVSLIQSLYGVFGSGVVAGDTGIMLQNRGAYFSLDPAHPNRLEPGKVPMHTLIASMGVRAGKLWSVLGCMGADGQPQIQMQAYVGLIDHGRDIQEVLDAPRFLSGRFALGEPRDTLHIEGRFAGDVLSDLERRGHLLDRWADWNEFAGHAHGILIDRATGLLHGGADPRSDGAAVGY